jgi:hypothetical protein
MRKWVLLCVLGCASTLPQQPAAGGPTVFDAKAAEEADQYHRDGVAFAIPAVSLLSAGLISGAAEISRAPDDPGWWRGTTIALLGAGVLATAVAFSFDVLERHARERATRPRLKLSDATRR